MDEADFSASEFLVGWCEACDREVLTHTGFDPDGGERRLCLTCDAALRGPLRSVAGADLRGLGLAEVAPGGGCGSCGCGRSSREPR